ncbi:Related to efflux pump antibiotic resistance protein [Desulfamplus magnetovallimortis]|uniref:Related to efflux pump antibiotic resistance protein n=1 Tax=Desulfamplus magnetovallimortis TaxID=1246637 RepID=A0A1W1H8T6_9BACT|nr:Related to efflux pump antibiotic resistance protein [Desulfamplus magnetovallimortis]
MISPAEKNKADTKKCDDSIQSSSEKSSEKNTSEAMTTAVVCIVQFITPFMMSGVGVALPSIGRHFSASAFQLGLAEMVYMLGVTLLLMPAGQVADIMGRKKVFLAGLSGFTVTTLMLALSGSMEMFLFMRFFQGLSVSLITTTSVAILSSVVPPSRRGRSMGIIVASVYAGLSAGPALGGFIVSHAGWRALFILTTLVAAAALGLSIVQLKGDWKGAPEQQIDYRGSLIYMVSLGLLITGISGADIFPQSKFLTITGVLGLMLFLFVESRVAFPLLNIKMIMKNRILGFTVIATLINYAASFGIIFFFSLYLQGVKGLSAKTAGMLLIIQTIVQCLLSPVAGRLADRIYPGRIATFGMAICTAGLLLATGINSDTSIQKIITIFVLMGTGYGFFSSPNITVIMNSVPQNAYGQASSLAATMRTLGMLASMTISAVLIARYMGDSPVNQATSSQFLQSLQSAMMLFAGMGFAGVFLSMGRVIPAENN